MDSDLIYCMQLTTKQTYGQASECIASQRVLFMVALKCCRGRFRSRQSPSGGNLYAAVINNKQYKARRMHNESNFEPVIAYAPIFRGFDSTTP
jgi:hypothetical protein